MTNLNNHQVNSKIYNQPRFKNNYKVVPIHYKPIIKIKQEQPIEPQIIYYYNHTIDIYEDFAHYYN